MPYTGYKGSSGSYLSHSFASPAFGGSAPTVADTETPGEKSKSEMLQAAARLIFSGSESRAAQGRTYLKNNIHLYSPDELKQYGLDDFIEEKNKDHRNLFEKAAGEAKGAVGGAIIKTAQVLARPQQAAVHLEKTLGETLGTLGYGIIHGKGVGRSLDVAGQTARDDFKETGKAATDLSGAHDINMRQALGLNKDAGADPNAKTLDPFGGTPFLGRLEFHGGLGGVAAGAADTLGAVATDPLTFVSGPSKEAVSAATKTAEDLSPGLSERITKGIATEAEKKALKAELVKKADAAIKDGAKVRQGGVLKRIKDASIAESAGEKGSLRGLEGADLVAQRNLTALEATGAKGLASPGLRALAGNAADHLPEGLAAHIPGSTAASSLKDALGRAFVPRFGLAKEFGDDVAGKFGTAEEAVAGERTLAETEQNARLGNALAAARKIDKVNTDELRNVIYPAMETADETGSGAAKLADAYRADGKEAAASLVDVLDRERRIITEAQQGEGLLPEEIQHNVDTWMHRVATPEGAKQLEKMAEGKVPATLPGVKPNKMLAELKQTGATEARSFSPEAGVEQANREARAAGFKGDLFASDPVVSMRMRGAQATRAIAESHYLDEVGAITDPHTGEKLLLRSMPEDAEASATIAKKAEELGYVAHPAGPLGTIYGPPSVVKEVARFQDVVLNDSTIKGVQRGLDKAQKVWKAYATVPGVSAAFQMRNAESNFILNWIAGYKNPALYVRAAKLQRVMSKATDLIGREGVETLDDALDKVGAKAADKAMLKDAVKENVIGSSYARNDIATKEGAGFAGMSGVERAKAGIAHPIHTIVESQPGTHLGRTLNQGIEDNARLAHFIGAMGELGDVKSAADSVKKFLFNYEDLTAFEREKLKRVIPFYTFMRKNTELMAKTLAENPGKLRRLEMAQGALGDPNEPTLAGAALPGYAVDDGQVSVGPNMLGSVDDPLSAAIRTVAPAVHIAAMTPGIELIAPDFLKDPQGFKGAALDVLNLPGGPPAEFLKVLAEQATGKSLFTGQDLPATDKVGQLLKIANIIAPVGTKTDGIVNALEGKKGGGSVEDNRRAQLIKMFLGLNTTPYSKESSDRAFVGRNAQMQDLIDGLNKGKALDDPGRIPTVTELRALGIIPEKASKSKKANDPFASSSTAFSGSDAFGPAGRQKKPLTPGEKTQQRALIKSLLSSGQMTPADASAARTKLGL